MADLIESMANGVTTLMLNNPGRRNAINRETFRTLLSTLERLSRDKTVGCVILTGAGGAFCSGGDVKESLDRGSDFSGWDGFDAASTFLRDMSECARFLHDMPKPVIAAIPGAAAGAGLSLALACDLRIAASSAKFVTSFVNVGLAGDFGGAYFLTKLVGGAKAKELFFLSETVSAEEALGLGIVNRVVEGDALQSETLKWAERLAAGPRAALAYMKRNINLAEHSTLAAALDQEALLHTLTNFTSDHAEAAKAFAEKRKPDFTARPVRP